MKNYAAERNWVLEAAAPHGPVSEAGVRVMDGSERWMLRVFTFSVVSWLARRISWSLMLVKKWPMLCADVTYSWQSHFKPFSLLQAFVFGKEERKEETIPSAELVARAVGYARELEMIV